MSRFYKGGAYYVHVGSRWENDTRDWQGLGVWTERGRKARVSELDWNIMSMVPGILNLCIEQYE